MNHKMLACLSESHFKDFLLSEITFFLVFESMQNCVKRIIEWVQRKRNQFTRSKEYNSKIKIFFAGNSGIIEITSCDQLHRKKLPEIIFVRWVTHCSHLPRGPNFVQNRDPIYSQMMFIQTSFVITSIQMGTHVGAVVHFQVLRYIISPF